MTDQPNKPDDIATTPSTWPGGKTGNEDNGGDVWRWGIINGRVFEDTGDGIVEREGGTFERYISEVPEVPEVPEKS